MMRSAAWAWPVLAVVVMLPSGIAVRAAPFTDANGPARLAIEACIDRIDKAPKGLPALEALCPELAAGLQAAQIRPLIIPSSRDLLDRDALRHLERLLHPALGPAPSVATLTPILHTLPGATVVPRSWWQRLWDWLLEHLNQRKSQSSNPWWIEMARQLSGAEWLWKGLIWGTLIALTIVVVLVLRLEIRAMGRRSTDDDAPSGGTEAAGASGAPSSRLALMRQVPLGQRPARLFAMLISRLVAAGRLPPDRSLTHREVVRAAVLDDAEQRRYMESLARLSERQLYSGVATTAADLEDLLARGEDLYITGWGRSVEG
jgi:hypothetical protein